MYNVFNLYTKIFFQIKIDYKIGEKFFDNRRHKIFYSTILVLITLSKLHTKDHIIYNAINKHKLATNGFAKNICLDL